jgi:RNA polymerase sigma-70 factor (ECF subfamily)
MCQEDRVTGQPPMDNQLRDDDLVRQLQAGDHGAFERLVIKYQDRVHNICFKLIGHAESARDVAQETFLKAFESIQQFEHKSSFFTWLYRIAVNMSISQRRRDHRHKVHQAGEVLEVLTGGTGRQALRLRALAAESQADAAPQELDRRERHEMVREALQQLDADYRVILVLRDMESLDYQAIADVLAVPIGTVRSRLHRGRLALKELLQDRLGCELPEQREIKIRDAQA